MSTVAPNAYDAAAPYDAAVPYDAVAITPPVVVRPVLPRIPPPVIVVQLDIDGVTHHYSDAEYGDPDPLTGIGTRWHDARLVGDIAYSRSAACVLWGSGRGSTGGLGHIELVNADGALDGLIAGSLADARVRVYVVDQDQPMALATPIAAARVARIEARGEQAIRLVTEDVLAALDVPLQDDLYTATPANGTLAGRPRPIAIGDPLSCPIVLVNEVDYEYDCHDHPGFEVLAVRDSGIVLDPVTQWQVSVTPGIDGIELLQVPAGMVVADLRTSAETSTPVVGPIEGDFDVSLSDWTVTTAGDGGAAAWASPGLARLTADSTAGAASAQLIFPADIPAGQRIGWSIGVDATIAGSDPVAAEALGFARLEVLFAPTAAPATVLRTVAVSTAAELAGTYTALVEGRFGFRVVATRGGIVEADVDGVRVDLLPPGNSPAAVLEAMLARGGIGAEQIHRPSLAALDSDRPWSLSFYTADAVTVREVLQQALDSLFGWAYADNAGRVRVGWLQPLTVGTPVLDLSAEDLAGEVEVEPDLAPGLSPTVAGQRNFHVHGAAELADGVTDEDRVLLTADYRVRKTATAPIAPELRPRGRVSDESRVGIPTLLDDPADIQAAADLLPALYPASGRRRFYKLPVFLSRERSATLNPGDLITFRHARFGFQTAPRLRVVGIDGRAGESTVTITAWG